MLHAAELVSLSKKLVSPVSEGNCRQRIQLSLIPFLSSCSLEESAQGRARKCILVFIG
jgi:hypothetical protein